MKNLIIGSGPAGYTAAIYAGRANLSPVLYTGMQMGGQLTQTTIVENFPGYPEGVDANQMMGELQQQATRFGADIRFGVITKVDLSKRPYTVTTDDGTELEADTIIIATGASAKYLGLVSMCHLRRILLSQEGCCRRGRRRHGMRGGNLSGWAVSESIHDSKKAIPQSIGHHEKARGGEP